MTMDYYRRLKLNIIVLVVLGVLIPLIGVGGNIYYYYRKFVQTTINENLKEVVIKRRQAIEVFLHEQVLYLKTLARFQSRGELPLQMELDDLCTSVLPLSNKCVDMGMIDADGIQFAYVGAYDLLGKNYYNAQWFQAVREKGVYISDVFLGFRKAPHLAIAVRSEAKGKPWYLRATVSTDTIKELMQSGQKSVAREAYLLSAADKAVQIHAGNMPIFQTADLKFPDPGDVIVQKVRTSDNRTLLTASTLMNDNRWLLVIAEDPNMEFVSFYHARRVALLLSLGTMLMVTLISIVASQWIVEKIREADKHKDMIQQQLTQTARLISLGKMASGLAHEINNPLAIINESAGYAKEILELSATGGAGLSEAQRREIHEALTDITKETFRARDITQNLLGFARKVDTKIMPVNVNDLLSDLLKHYVRILAKVGNIQIIKKFDPDIPPIRTDSGQLQQVVINLIDNAVYFTRQVGGTITIETENNEAGVCIHISDDGPGMPPRVKEKIFDPFFTTKPVGKGTGLGLAICFGIIRKLGGKILVESEEGQGATFTIVLPRTP